MGTTDRPEKESSEEYINVPKMRSDCVAEIEGLEGLTSRSSEEKWKRMTSSQLCKHRPLECDVSDLV